MTDQPQAETVAEKDTQPEPMPSSEEKTTEVVETEEVGESEAKPVEASADELPEEASDRTKGQFDKLTKELAKEREERIRLERTFNSLQPKQPSTPSDWYNAETGEVDVTKLTAREQQTTAELNRLRTQLDGFNRINEQQQEKEAYAVYPELDPKSGNFDDELQEHVISYMATSMAKGNTPTLKEAADKVMSLATRTAKKAEKEGAKKALEQLSPKEEASLGATGRSDRRLPSVDIEALRAKTRIGGTKGAEAIMARMKSITPVGK